MIYNILLINLNIHISCIVKNIKISYINIIASINIEAFNLYLIIYLYANRV